MANMTFGVNLIPNNNTQQRTLGNDQNKWDINANTITATTINGNNVTNGVKATQSAVADPVAEGTSLEFIDSISQNTQGVITPTKKTVASATTSTAGLMSAADKTKLNGIETGAEVNPDIVNNLTETTIGKVLDATQGKALNDTKLNKNFNFTAATLPYSNNEKLVLQGTDGNNYYTTIGELASQIGGSGGGTSQTALVHYIKNCGTISTLNWTNPTIDNNITENMVVLKAELTNPAAQTSDWTCTTTNGYVTISGTISGSTDVLLYFGVSLSAAPSIIVNLASNSSDNILKTTPTPGVMGVLGTVNGGTGVNATDAADLRSKLGITPANIGAVSTSTVIDIAHGGTNSTTRQGAVANLFPDNQASDAQYLPSIKDGWVGGNIPLPLDPRFGGTGATTLAGARTNLGIAIPNAGSLGIDAAVDLNNITTSGLYSIVNINTIYNDIGSWGYLLVISIGSSGQVLQVRLPYDYKDVNQGPAPVYFRRKNLDSGTAWSDWVNLGLTPIANGGTGATTPAMARANLGLNDIGAAQAQSAINPSNDGQWHQITITSDCWVCASFHVAANTDGSVNLFRNGNAVINNPNTNGSCNYWANAQFPCKAGGLLQYALNSNATDSNIYFLTV